jgi:predicted TIM-barrel fold metal-dependent hydrolase
MRTITLEEHYATPAFLEQLPVSAADKARIAHGNAERLLRL